MLNSPYQFWNKVSLNFWACMSQFQHSPKQNAACLIYL
jgi:hypothetical protein